MAANSEGRAYIAPWIIKMVAGAALVGTLAWAGGVDKVTKTDVPVLQRDVVDLKGDVETANAKLDLLLQDRGLKYVDPQQPKE